VDRVLFHRSRGSKNVKIEYITMSQTTLGDDLAGMRQDFDLTLGRGVPRNLILHWDVRELNLRDYQKPVKKEDN